MNIKKLAPWNWFKNEEEVDGSVVPAGRRDIGQQEHRQPHVDDPVAQLQRSLDRLFGHTGHRLGDFGLSFDGFDPLFPLADSSRMKPKVDIGATDSEYTITAEIPGIRKDDIKVELDNDTLTIRGEKKQEKEEKKKDFYRIERSYGSFQRILNLPADADQEKIESSFKNGVLTIKMPRKQIPESQVKQIEIKE